MEGVSENKAGYFALRAQHSVEDIKLLGEDQHSVEDMEGGIIWG